MISSLWKDTKFYCAGHTDSPLTLTPNASHTAFDYFCSECNLRVPTTIIEKAFDKISSAIADAEFDGLQLDITGTSYKVGDFILTVTEYNLLGKTTVFIKDRRLR